jgi:hypothetical protein
MKRLLLVLALAATVMGAIPASAETLSIPASAFSQEGAPNGLLVDAQGTFVAPIVFPVTTGCITSLILFYRDFDGENDITARLKRKRAMVGDNAFAEPTLLAEVSSSESLDTVRKKTTTTITGAAINSAKYFYYAEVELPFSTLQVLGVMVGYSKTACS